MYKYNVNNCHHNERVEKMFNDEVLAGRTSRSIFRVMIVFWRVRFFFFGTSCGGMKVVFFFRSSASIEYSYSGR